MNGKLCDVLIEELTYSDDAGLIKFLHLTVYADAGNRNIIEKVEGVTNVYNPSSESEYDVFLDPRYDREYVKSAIEAAIKIDGVNK